MQTLAEPQTSARNDGGDESHKSATPGTRLPHHQAKWRLLVKLAGGPHESVRITRGSESRVSEAGAPDKMGPLRRSRPGCRPRGPRSASPSSPPRLADLAGYDLVKRDRNPPTSPPSIRQDREGMRRRAVHMAAAMADGDLNPLERAEIIGEAKQAIDQLQNLIVVLRGQA